MAVSVTSGGSVECCRNAVPTSWTASPIAGERSRASNGPSSSPAGPTTAATSASRAREATTVRYNVRASGGSAEGSNGIRRVLRNSGAPPSQAVRGPPCPLQPGRKHTVTGLQGTGQLAVRDSQPLRWMLGL
jgi:hypothetical protein